MLSSIRSGDTTNSLSPILPSAILHVPGCTQCLCWGQKALRTLHRQDLEHRPNTRQSVPTTKSPAKSFNITCVEHTIFRRCGTHDTHSQIASTRWFYGSSPGLMHQTSSGHAACKQDPSGRSTCRGSTSRWTWHHLISAQHGSGKLSTHPAYQYLRTF